MNRHNCIRIIAKFANGRHLKSTSLFHKIRMSEPCVTDPQSVNNGFFFTAQSLNIKRSNFRLDCIQFIGSISVSIFPSMLPFLSNKRFYKWIKIGIGKFELAVWLSSSSSFSSLVSLFISSNFTMTGNPAKLYYLLTFCHDIVELTSTPAGHSKEN